jgi:Ca2+-binding EF-hand superfamily protein
VWSLTEREGDTLSQDKAAPFIVNFEMVDTDKDGKITEDEFLEGCKQGLVQEQPSKPGETGGGQTPEQPTKQ